MPQNNNESSGNKILTISAAVLTESQFLAYIDDLSVLAFSKTCQAAQRITHHVRKKIAVKCLLSAVVCGNEDFARKIVTFRPELLLDSSVMVKDHSGKKIENLTPLQAAICAGDVDMVQMIQDVLQQKKKLGISLSFDPAIEIQRQFNEIYPNMDINLVVTEQKIKAQEFKNSSLNKIFAILDGATQLQVKFELDTPEMSTTDSELNAALHRFRKQFTATANLEQIFNPFYLEMAYELYDEMFDNFNNWNYRDLFWRQVIGYIQRHLPACYLQAFAQGIYYILVDKENLKRSLEFRFDKGLYMQLANKDVGRLGYQFAVGAGAAGARLTESSSGGWAVITPYKQYCEQKNQVWQSYLRAESREASAVLPGLRIDNRKIYRCCSIC